MASNSFTGNKNVITSRTEFLLKEMVQEKLTKAKNQIHLENEQQNNGRCAEKC